MLEECDTLLDYSAVNYAGKLIEKHESYRQFVYDDYDGKPIVPGMQVYGHATIGYGTSLDIDGIPSDIASILMLRKIKEIRLNLEKFSWWTDLTSPRKAVLIDMAYNLGVDGLLKFKGMIAALENSAWDQAANEMLDSEWAKQTGSRATDDAAIMRSGEYSDGNPQA